MDKRKLYESIMKSVAVEVKKALNEDIDFFDKSFILVYSHKSYHHQYYEYYGPLFSTILKYAALDVEDFVQYNSDKIARPDIYLVYSDDVSKALNDFPSKYAIAMFKAKISNDGLHKLDFTGVGNINNWIML